MDRAPVQPWLAGTAGLAAVAWGAQQFAPLLSFYENRLGLSASWVQATFVVYVVGLVPGLLAGGALSDRIGRRKVVLPTLVLSAAASVFLVVGGSSLLWLLTGRLLSGVASGAAFSAGTAWLRELSALGGTSGARAAPRRATVAMTIGFGLGPLVAGVIAQWAPAPTLFPYVPHLVLTAGAFIVAVSAPETTVPAATVGDRRLKWPTDRRFRTIVLPLAPWVFACAAIALAYLPTLVRDRLGQNAIVFGAAVTALTAGAGIAVQPLIRTTRQDRRSLDLRVRLALSVTVTGMAGATLAAAVRQPMVVLGAAVVLGGAYGVCQAVGFAEVQRLAPPEQLAGVTAIYQATSYLGYVVPLPLAAAGRVVSPTVLLTGLTTLAASTLLWVIREGYLAQPNDQPPLVAAIEPTGPIRLNANDD